VFENLRRSLNELLERATKPEDRREALSRMKDTLVRAKLGLDDLRTALEQSRVRLAAEQRELETVRRRKKMATDINDAETVGIAERFERHHEERAGVLIQKVAAQENELMLAEREVAEMTAELRRALAGVPEMPQSTISSEDPLADSVPSTEAFDALARARARADRDAEAARRLEELKRKMGQ
jgi:hypothetical protein